MKSIHALSIDLEDWYHPELVRKRISGDFIVQIDEATQPILKLLDRYQVKATVFVLGEVAEKSPALIETIYHKGHEIASHGFSHRPLWELDEDGFREEMMRFHAVIQKVLGPMRIKGFRAPTFSLDNRTKWAIKILVELGYQYDASIFPVKLNRLYGLTGAPTKPYRISMEDLRTENPNSSLIEFPMSVLEWMGMRIPISGGFYLRLTPLPLLRWGLKKISRCHPFFLYLHPWEGYLRTPHLKLPLADRIITYYGMKGVLKKLEALFKEFEFTRMDRILGLEEAS
jgi:polysaccharide deacetylase family protein (PEP-CTERM system associated)